MSVPWFENSGLWTRVGDEKSGSFDGANIDNRLDFLRGVDIVTSIFNGGFSRRCNS